MIKKLDKNTVRTKRHNRMRVKLSGTPETPRLNVYRSLSHIYTQIIDDINGVTLVAASTMEKDIAAKVAGKTKVEAAKIVGTAIAERALQKGIKAVVFDRGGYIYTGRVQAVADGARKAGLEF
ncbi:MAG: 50S ribosomal protein L18 [Clostridia bacterium]|nr:50S ribosomal protein L18 [Clostridia bacterium]